MKPVNICFGNLSKCCCCSLAAGTITWTVFLGIAALFNIILDSSVTHIISTVVSVVRVVLLIWALVKYNWIILLLVCALAVFDLVLNLIQLLAIRLPVVLKLDDTVRGQQLFGVIVELILFILVTLYFVSILLSLANVYMVYGTGWEGKNWKQIQHENESKNKDNENSKRDAEDDVEISH